ncbi:MULTISPECIES: helix-turn-helix transcriptional regulator [Streptomyces]|uniref:helix-turn-helix transcriptional regulator n=1 Tax=Streptomyces TaxID=1883 RepID=UPI00207AA085|nr:MULTISPECIES: AraC family transcriptional regulator [Streptomyces]MCM9077266.1 AraC family transcriptional regulator [Streptomyces spororaveus]MCX5309332.1 AraC family transcriptional regulator [Streptomyces sp. NBC_00160]
MPQQPQAVPPGGQSFRTTEVDVARDWLKTSYGTSLRMAAPAPGSAFQYSRISAGPLALSTLALPTEYSYATGPLGAVAVTHVVGGRMVRECKDDVTRAAPGDVLAISQPHLPYAGRVYAAELRAVTVPLTLVQEAAGRPAGQGRPLRFTRFTPVSPAMADQWKRTADYVGESLLALPADGAPLVVDAAARLLAATVLAAFPTDARPEPVLADTRDATSETVRRAIAFIESHPAAEIGLADTAAAAGVTPRALQYAFRRHLGTTPMGYLRRVRLAQAHDDLVAADPARDTVTAVAHRWGFHHQGRFAAAYRQAYGVLPRHTLTGP